MTLPTLYLETADGYYLNFDVCDPTFEQVLVADLMVAAIPASTPTTPNNYSSGKGGGAVGYNLRLFEDTITITGMLRLWSDYWTIYEWAKYDHRPKTLGWGGKTYTVHIRRFSGSAKAGQHQIITFNMGLVVINPPG